MIDNKYIKLLNIPKEINVDDRKKHFESEVRDIVLLFFNKFKSIQIEPERLKYCHDNSSYIMDNCKFEANSLAKIKKIDQEYYLLLYIVDDRDRPFPPFTNEEAQDCINAIKNFNIMEKKFYRELTNNRSF